MRKALSALYELSPTKYRSRDGKRTLSTVIVSGAKDPEEKLYLRNLVKELNLDDAMNHDEEWQARRDTALAEINAFTVKVATDAWYPILDYERCVDCGKCHDFCLFGVYSIEDGKVKVAQPQNCKNNCPACSRVCPAEAVIFPKYERSPINGGSASEEGVIMLDMDTMYADALRARLEQRRASVMLFKDKK